VETGYFANPRLRIAHRSPGFRKKINRRAAAWHEFASYIIEPEELWRTALRAQFPFIAGNARTRAASTRRVATGVFGATNAQERIFAMDQTVADEKFTPEVVADLTRTLDHVMNKTITDIDTVNDQIRVLALNARIEAARAGEAGKAFNIVAMEIASLSSTSAKVVNNLKNRSGATLERIGKVSKQMATAFKGTRMSDVALMNIDLIDRNLYERSCDVRWWATDASLVEALTKRTSEAYSYASKRLGVILDSYTVYYDLVLADLSGTIVANGRPDQFRSHQTEHAHAEWFRSALATRSGTEFGFHSVHRSPLVNDRFALVYSCCVREGGEVNGRPLGVLGIVFNWEALAQTIVNGVALTASEKARTRVCIVDDRGLVLADSHNRILADTIEFAERSRLFKKPKDYCVSRVDDKRCCVAHASSPGFETYATGWHSLLIQELNESRIKHGEDIAEAPQKSAKSKDKSARKKRKRVLA
jgi:hypothetical protein